jgi:Ca2+-binding EF-hand superfamily protein
MTELERVFSRFDADGDEKVSSREVPLILKSIGQNLTDSELRSLYASTEEDGALVGKSRFLEFMQRLLLQDIEAKV